MNVFQLCDNVSMQRTGQPLPEVLAAHGVSIGEPPAVGSRSFLHLCNPFRSAAGAAGDRLQELTFATMHDACRFARQAEGEQRVDFLAVAYPDDESFARRFFPEVAFLGRSVLDVATFAKDRRLPVLFDLLEAGRCRPADFVVFTNTDICLMPAFYRAVGRLLDWGFDGLVINRRTIAEYALDPALAPVMAADYGAAHEGYDCFVFPWRMLERFQPTNACVGAGGVMRSLIYNLVAECTRLLFLTDVHLTYHIGHDRPWTHFPDYIDHNWREAIVLLRSLARRQPERFRQFCDNLPERIRVEPAAEGPRLVKAPGSTARVPPLD
jgi:hypothetical protein